MTNQATLKELVQGAVEGFLATDTPFSVHNLTTSIRQLVNSGAVTVPSLFVDGKDFKYEIGHDDVKFYFQELFNANSFSRQVGRRFEDPYFLYFGVDSNSTTDPTSSTDTGDAFSRLTKALAAMRPKSILSTPKTTNFDSSPRVQVTTAKVGRNEIIKRVRTYFNNCSDQGFLPSSKQIQSAVKRGDRSTGWSRSELRQIWQDIADGSL